MLNQTKVYEAIVAVVGYVTKATNTKLDDAAIQAIKDAAEDAINYEGDVEDVIEVIFEALEEATNTIPGLKEAVWDDIMLKILKGVVMNIFNVGDGFKIRPILTFFRELRAKNKERREERRDDRKEDRRERRGQ